MADPTTELTKEFLEINNYLVRKETKFQNKVKDADLFGTCSDIDILAISQLGIQRADFQLSKIIIGEVKNYSITSNKKVDSIYDKKFHFFDSRPKFAWAQLRDLIPKKEHDKVIFCRATSQQVYDYALKKYNIKIVTVGLMIKLIAEFFKHSDRNWTYYPERYHYNVIKNIMNYLYECYKWKDKLTLSDLVWIDPKEEPRWRNRFLETNAKFFEDFVYYQTSGDILEKIIKRTAEEYPPFLKRTLKKNKKFWEYLNKK